MMRVLGNVLRRSNGFAAVVTVVHGLNESPLRIVRRADRWTYTHPEAAKAGPWRRVETDFATQFNDDGVVSLFRYEHEDRAWT